MAQIQPPETFDFSTPNEWPKWRKRFERYLVDLLEKEEEATKIDSVFKAFDSHFCVRKNIIYERAKFNSRNQEDREPVDEFITSLYKLADSCEFEGLHEKLIRDRIVVGVRDKALSERMQLDSELTLEKAVKLVRQQEAVRQQQVDLQRPSTSQKVNQVKFNSKKQSPKQQQQLSRKKEKSAKTRSRCPKFGGFTHREGQACRAEGQRCNLCSKTDHFANCCPDKQAKTAEVKAVSELDEEIGFLLEVSSVEDSSNLDDDEGECRRQWTAEIQVNGKQVKFKLDSQADVTCVPLCLFKKIMGQQRLVKSDINIRAAEFSELQTVGMFISTLRNGNYEIKEKIYVIRRLSEPLLSRRACELLNLARRIEVVATRNNPIKEFPEVFEGLGQIVNPYEIKLKPGAKPYAVQTPRRLKTRLEELEKAGIIAQVNVATEWCAPTVIAGKPNGDIRLYLKLNEHVQREVHPMPVVEHMLGQLGEARFFSKLDANSGFHQIPLSPDSQHLTNFITSFGRYKFCRMPFGISFAPEYFQKVMSIILQGMNGVKCYLDDILIFASDSKTHDRILRFVLRKLKEAKVTLNKAKCVFGVPRINFLGHILYEDGIRPDPAKIEAVAKMPAPTDVHGVRRFLGMLLVKGQDFVWDCSQERAFRKLKELLTTQPILAAYDIRKPTMVSSDASSYGLGAVLKQEGKNGIWRPVAYSSRTMTPTEKRYAQIEKETLAITWACERFQDFLLGKSFRIETDHKPLIPLFSTKELSSLTPRLQRFRMRMMRFGFEIVHIPGKGLLDADALSRQPLLTTEGGENERPTSAHIKAVLSCITDKDEMLTKIFEAQQEDMTLKAVVNYLEQGWPDKKKMSQALLSYWHAKDELGVQNGLLMRSCRLVIPASMKLEILDMLHAGHFGITKTRLRARETVWWPGISEEIAETIGMDLFKFENKLYLVVNDYCSRFPEMIQLDRLTANVVVHSCKSTFARHEIPETVVSDNGTQFGVAREFANFARQYGFTHVTSSPRFPQSNGMAEAGVKIAKLILKKNQDPSLGLLEYRSTPLENGYSPAELLMGRKLRTTLPIAPENLNPRLVDSQTLRRKEGRMRKDMKSRYDHAAELRTWRSYPKQKASTPRSYMVDTPVGTVRRNRFHLRKGDTVQYPADPSTPTFSGEELVENEKTPVVDYPSNDSEDGQSKIRVFRNGGRLARSDVWFWGQQPLTVSSKYTYLGYPLTTKNPTAYVAQHFKSKALVDTNAVWRILSKSRTKSFGAVMKLLDSIVLSTLLAPLWATNQIGVVNQIQDIFLRRYLDLPKYTPGYILRTETGRMSLELNITKLILNFWIRILKMNRTSLPYVCLSQLWKNCEDYMVVRGEMPRTMDQLLQFDRAKIQNSTHFICYQSLSSSFMTVDYLPSNLPLKIKRFIARKRILWLLFREDITGFWNSDPLNCYFCNVGIQDNLVLYLFHCPFLQEKRLEIHEISGLTHYNEQHVYTIFTTLLLECVGFVKPKIQGSIPFWAFFSLVRYSRIEFGEESSTFPDNSGCLGLLLLGPTELKSIVHLAFLRHLAHNLLPASTDGSPSQPPSTDGSTSQPPSTDGSTSQPPSTDGSTSQPASTDESSSQPPSTDGSTSQPPSTDGSTSQPPSTDGSTSQPASTDESSSQPASTDEAQRLEYAEHIKKLEQANAECRGFVIEHISW
ncbi:K02A2.6-like [Cordylochernes scorpioides]|uniref:RNA-directed DNA polymerase n=1 Tax=Cordylochernes scorpioides TaxID=51811 RepID=A0ABY6K7L0_9ARAC|nr:K02A2.6-like [Cordylochernes scorpioides]